MILCGELFSRNFIKFQKNSDLFQRLSICVVHFYEKAQVVIDRTHEMRMLVTRISCKLEKDFQTPPHQRLRLGEAVGGLEQQSEVVEAAGDIWMICP